MFQSVAHTTETSTQINNMAASKPCFFQPRLTINQPNDIYEQEADAMAEKVMRMPMPAANSQPFFSPAISPIQRKCAACEDEEKKVQMKTGIPDIQKDDQDQKEGVEFKPFPTGVKGRWPGFGFNVDITNTQFDFGNPADKQLSLGLNYPGEPYAALTVKDFAFKLGYDFAENNLFAGGRYKGLSYGLMAGFDNPSFGLGLGYGHFPLFNYNMRSSFQFGNTALPYDFMYHNELDKTDAAVGNWQQGGATDPERAISLIGEAANFASMTGDMFDVANKPKYNWGAGINVGYDPQLQWYFMAGLKFYLGKEDQKKTVVSPKLSNCNDPAIQLKDAPDDQPAAGSGFENYVNSLNSYGSPLPQQSKQFFEQRFGNDFSNVRIHNDSIAAKSAQSINALAYTSGNNIVFNNGQYSPETDTGKKLLAHELTHVVQQKGSTPPKIQKFSIEIGCGGEDKLAKERMIIQGFYDGEALLALAIKTLEILLKSDMHSPLNKAMYGFRYYFHCPGIKELREILALLKKAASIFRNIQIICSRRRSGNNIAQYEDIVEAMIIFPEFFEADTKYRPRGLVGFLISSFPEINWDVDGSSGFWDFSVTADRMVKNDFAYEYAFQHMYSSTDYLQDAEKLPCLPAEKKKEAENCGKYATGTGRYVSVADNGEFSPVDGFTAPKGKIILEILHEGNSRFFCFKGKKYEAGE